MTEKEAHGLHFATHSLTAERLTDKNQQQQDSKQNCLR
jgi:hypothetical protein